MASFSLLTSQPSDCADTVSQTSLPIGGKYIVDGIAMGVMTVLFLLHDIKKRLINAADNIEFMVVKVEHLRAQ